MDTAPVPIPASCLRTCHASRLGRFYVGRARLLIAFMRAGPRPMTHATRSDNRLSDDFAREVDRDPARIGLSVQGLPPLGSLTLGALAVCVASGVVLLTGFEPSRPLVSTLAFETGRPFGWFVRALHASSAQLALLALLAHTADHVLRKADRQTSFGGWSILVASLPVTLYLMLGGRAMPGDAEGVGVASVLAGIVARLPWVGEAAASVLAGGTDGANVHVLAAHHVATATLVLALITVYHVRKLAPDAIAAGTALGVSGAISLVWRPALVGTPADGKLYGPWYMGALRLALEHVPVWLAGMVVPAVALGGLCVLPWLTPRGARLVRWALGVLLAAVVALTVAAVRA